MWNITVDALGPGSACRSLGHTSASTRRNRTTNNLGSTARVERADDFVEVLQGVEKIRRLLAAV